MFNNVLLIVCPHCQSLHAYELEVHRVARQQEHSFYEKPSPSSQFTKVFSCPERQYGFEYTFLLVEFPETRIDSVEVKGVIDLKGG
jgi:hypothetical protein